MITADDYLVVRLWLGGWRGAVGPGDWDGTSRQINTQQRIDGTNRKWISDVIVFTDDSVYRQLIGNK